MGWGTVRCTVRCMVRCVVWCMVWYELLYDVVWYQNMVRCIKKLTTAYLFNYNDPIIMHLSLHDGMHMSQKYPQMLRTVSVRNNNGKLKCYGKFYLLDILSHRNSWLCLRMNKVLDWRRNVPVKWTKDDG